MLNDKIKKKITNQSKKRRIMSIKCEMRKKWRGEIEKENKIKRMRTKFDRQKN
jgi:hypothetical protein